MKIAVGSDLHVEFGDIILKNDDNVDLLILAGDICVINHLTKQTPYGDIARDFWKRVSFQFPKVLYVMGNHEHYGGDFAKSKRQFEQFCAANHIYNIILMDKETVEIDGYQFIGGTLWTDFNDMDSHTMFNAQNAMNDYRGVKNTDDKVSWKFLPKHALRDHCEMKRYLQTCMDNYKEAGRLDNKIVVITHHAPSKQSIHEKYANDSLMNGNFASDLDQFIEANPQIQLWIHGHMHDPFDYDVFATRVLCNPRGYINYESRANEFQLKVLELL